MNETYDEAVQRLNDLFDNDLLAPDGNLLLGSNDVIPSTAYGRVFRENDTTKIEYNGETKVHWDGQETVTINNEDSYVSENGEIWRESQLITKAQYLNLLQLKSLSSAVNPPAP